MTLPPPGTITDPSSTSCSQHPSIGLQRMEAAKDTRHRGRRPTAREANPPSQQMVLQPRFEYPEHRERLARVRIYQLSCVGADLPVPMDEIWKSISSREFEIWLQEQEAEDPFFDAARIPIDEETLLQLAGRSVSRTTAALLPNNSSNLFNQDVRGHLPHRDADSSRHDMQDLRGRIRPSGSNLHVRHPSASRDEIKDEHEETEEEDEVIFVSAKGKAPMRDLGQQISQCHPKPSRESRDRRYTPETERGAPEADARKSKRQDLLPHSVQSPRSKRSRPTYAEDTEEADEEESYRDDEEPQKHVALRPPRQLNGVWQTPSQTRSRTLWPGGEVPEGSMFTQKQLDKYGAAWRCEGKGLGHAGGRTMIHNNKIRSCRLCKQGVLRAATAIMDFALPHDVDCVEAIWPPDSFSLSSRAGPKRSGPENDLPS